jgi:hypothetical protein
VACGLRLALSGQGWRSAVLLLSVLPLAIAAAADGQRVSVMGQTVQGGTGQQVVVKDLGPFLEGAIAGDYVESAELSNSRLVVCASARLPLLASSAPVSERDASVCSRPLPGDGRRVYRRTGAPRQW